MAREEIKVSIIADNIAHVRDVPEGKTKDDVKADFFTERAKKELVIEGGIVTLDEAVSEAPAVKVTKADINGPGPCPYCGKVYKNRRPHVPHCKKGPGGAL